MSRLGRDKLREERFSRSRQVTGWIRVMRRSDLVKEIGQTCDRSATVRPACRTLNRRMVTAAEPVYSTCKNEEEYGSWAPIWMRFSRWRQCERMAQIADGGRKLGRNSPTECRYWIH